MTAIKCNLTIITATYNAGQTLCRLIKSVRAQTSKEFEFIVIDGGSTDNTLEIIDSNLDLIDYWISCKDEGIYDAWNKGIQRSSGRWIGFIGADDVLKPNSIEYLNTIIHNLPDSSINFISCQAELFIESEGKMQTIGSKWHPWLINICHVMALHKATLYDHYGLYNLQYKIVGDYEFLLRCRKEIKPFFIQHSLVVLGNSGVSKSIKAIKEIFRARVETGKISVLLACLLYLWNVFIFKYNKYKIRN